MHDVIIVEVLPHLNGTKTLQERALSNPKIEIKCGHRIMAIRGSDHVEAIDILEEKTNKRRVLEVDGVLAYIGLLPNTDYLKGTLPIDNAGQIIVNESMETGIEGIIAAGDIRHNSPMQIVTAVGDGATAAISLGKYLEGR